MNVEALRLEAGETVRDDLKLFADGIEMIESFLQAEIIQVVGAEFAAQEAENFSYCYRKACFQNARKT